MQPRLELNSCRALLADMQAAPSGSTLNAQETARTGSMRTALRRQQFAAGRWLARSMLASMLGGRTEDWQISAEADAKPTVLGQPDVHLSLSHSGDTVACAIASQPVGLDVERVDPRRPVMDMAALVCSVAEQASLHHLPAHQLPAGFAALWCRKEARLKQLGLPLNFERLRSMEFVHAPPEAAQVGTWQFSTAGVVLALAGPDLARLQTHWHTAGTPDQPEWHQLQ